MEKSNNLLNIYNGIVFDNLETKLKINDKEFKFNSFVHNFRNFMYKVLGGVLDSNTQIKNLSNSNIASPNNVCKINSGENAVTHGIILGNTSGTGNSGISAYETSLSDYNLHTPLPNVGVDYEAMATTVALKTESREVKLVISRRFYFNVTTTITELGLVASNVITGDGSSTSFLICRDIISPQTFPPDSVIKVTMEFTLKGGNGFLINFLKILLSYFNNAAVEITNVNRTTDNVTFSNGAIGWKLRITESNSPIVAEQISLDREININGSHNKLSYSTGNNTISYVIFKSSFDNTTSATYDVKQLGIVFTKSANDYLVSLIKIGNSSGIRNDGIILVPEKLYRANHSIGFRKDSTINEPS